MTVPLSNLKNETLGDSQDSPALVIRRATTRRKQRVVSFSNRKLQHQPSRQNLQYRHIAARDSRDPEIQPIPIASARHEALESTTTSVLHQRFGDRREPIHPEHHGIVRRDPYRVHWPQQATLDTTASDLSSSPRTVLSNGIPELGMENGLALPADQVPFHIPNYMSCSEYSSSPSSSSLAPSSTHGSPVVYFVDAECSSPTGTEKRDSWFLDEFVPKQAMDPKLQSHSEDVAIPGEPQATFNEFLDSSLTGLDQPMGLSVSLEPEQITSEGSMDWLGSVPGTRPIRDPGGATNTPSVLSIALAQKRPLSAFRSKATTQNSPKPSSDQSVSIGKDRVCETKKRTSAEPESGKLLACPFYKLNPLRNSSCLKFELHRISDVKQHLHRKHTIGNCCSKSRSMSQGSASQDAHSAAPCCSRGARNREDGLTEDQREDLKRRVSKDDSRENQWFEVWELLFPPPEYTRPKSAYIERNIFGETASYVLGILTQKRKAAIQIVADSKDFDDYVKRNGLNRDKALMLLRDIDPLLQDQFHNVLQNSLTKGSETSSQPSEDLEATVVPKKRLLASHSAVADFASHGTSRANGQTPQAEDRVASAGDITPTYSSSCWLASRGSGDQTPMDWQSSLGNMYADMGQSEAFVDPSLIHPHISASRSLTPIAIPSNHRLAGGIGYPVDF